MKRFRNQAEILRPVSLNTKTISAEEGAKSAFQDIIRYCGTPNEAKARRNAADALLEMIEPLFAESDRQRRDKEDMG